MKYQIIIKDLENDEEILNRKCEAIIGGIGIGDNKEKGYETCQMVAVCGNFKSVASTLECSENAVNSARDHLLNDIINKDPNSPLAHLKAFFDSINKAREDSGDAGGDR